MTTWVVTRHPGTLDWLSRQGVEAQRIVAHLNIEELGCGDNVIGTLPVDKIAAVWRRGARYYHLCVNMPFAARGTELTADDLDRYGAVLGCFYAEQVDA